MPNITKVTFHSANPKLDEYGNPIASSPPESVELTWDQVVNNVGFSFSSGESLFTELTDPSNTHKIRVVNGFYFGSGKYGCLLAIQYHYDDGTDGWVQSSVASGGNATNTSMMSGNWIKGLTYEQILNHANWKGKPFIGLENDYIDFTMNRIIPDIALSLSPLGKTIYVGDSVTFDYSIVDYCEGEPTGQWIFQGATTSISGATGRKTFDFTEVGVHSVQLTVQNACGQSATKAAIIDVQEKPVQACDLSLTPSTITIRLGQTATFNAIHPYAEVAEWAHDLTLEVIEKQNKKLVVKPRALGSYSIKYTVGHCEDTSILYVLEEPEEGDYEEPNEPAPPALPDTPPDTAGTPSLAIDLMDASKPIPPLYKYPNIMKRNVRYRGHRESEKMLNDHQEQIYDIRQLYKDIGSLDEMKDITITSWFHGVENLSISMKVEENENKLKETQSNPSDTDVDSVRVLTNDVVQLSGNSFEERIVGIYGIKRRMQELDERIAEAERRYRDYENAYE